MIPTDDIYGFATFNVSDMTGMQKPWGTAYGHIGVREGVSCCLWRRCCRCRAVVVVVVVVVGRSGLGGGPGDGAVVACVILVSTTNSEPIASRLTCRASTDVLLPPSLSLSPQATYGFDSLLTFHPALNATIAIGRHVESPALGQRVRVLARACCVPLSALVRVWPVIIEALSTETKRELDCAFKYSLCTSSLTTDTCVLAHLDSTCRVH
jgi:hypothetical protein